MTGDLRQPGTVEYAILSSFLPLFHIFFEPVYATAYQAALRNWPSYCYSRVREPTALAQLRRTIQTLLEISLGSMQLL